jgi:hypothetical protein
MRPVSAGAAKRTVVTYLIVGERTDKQIALAHIRQFAFDIQG